MSDERAGTRVRGPTLIQQRNLVTEIPGPRSRELQERKLGSFARAVGMTLPVYVEAAGGGVVVDVDDNSLIDFGSGIAVTTVGNSAPAVVEAVIDQVQAFTHTCLMVTPYRGYLEVAEALNRLTPGEHTKRTALFNSGAEAVENAAKIARVHTRRQAIAVFDHAYPFRDGNVGGPEAVRRAITLIDTQIGAANLAAVVIEPIHGEGGFIVPAPGFLAGLADGCRPQGVVFIADEVQTSIARASPMFACDHEGVVQDLIVTAKGIASGLPLSAVTERAEIMDSRGVGGLSGTYGGNPLACAAALAVLATIERDGLIGRAAAVGAFMTSRLAALQAGEPRVGEVRGTRCDAAVGLVRDGIDPDHELATGIAAYCHKHGVIVLTCGTYGNVLRFLPPLAIPDHLLSEGLDIIADAFAAN